MIRKTIAIGEINSGIERDEAGYMRQCVNTYRSQVEDVARDIYRHRRDNAVVLLTGPSGSGKTTTAKMLEHMLDGWGCETHTISMDDYFAPFTKEQWEEIEKGELDFESPQRIDIPFLNEQLEKVVACEAVDLPTYDFTNSKRVFTDRRLARKPGEIVIYEGIHALNPDVIFLPEKYVSRVYVSVRTRIAIGEKIVHPSCVRLLRRLIRDRLNRGRTFAHTVSMYESVERGEKLYIEPHKSRAQYELDSFQPYELAVYRGLLEKEREALVTSGAPADAIALLAESVRASVGNLPDDALIREFVG